MVIEQKTIFLALDSQFTYLNIVETLKIKYKMYKYLIETQHFLDNYAQMIIWFYIGFIGICTERLYSIGAEYWLQFILTFQFLIDSHFSFWLNALITDISDGRQQIFIKLNNF